MNKIVHIFTEIIDAPEPHKVMKKNSVRVTRIHNAHAECQLDNQCTPHIFISCSPIGHQQECMNNIQSEKLRPWALVYRFIIIKHLFKVLQTAI